MKTINVDTVSRGIKAAYDRGNYAIKHLPPELKPPLHCISIFDTGEDFVFLPSMHHLVFQQYPVLDEAMSRDAKADQAKLSGGTTCDLVTILILAYGEDYDMPESTKNFLIKRTARDSSIEFATKFLKDYRNSLLVEEGLESIMGEIMKEDKEDVEFAVNS